MQFSAANYQSNNSEYTQIPAGLHNARIFMLALLGSVRNDYFNSESLTLRIGLEIAPVVPDGRNEIRYHDVTASMGSKAELRRIIEGIERKTLTQEEAGKYQIESILGRFVQVEVIHNQSKKDPSKVYEKFGKYFQTEKEFPTKKSLIFWDFNKDDLSILPQKTQVVVMRTREFKDKHGYGRMEPQSALGQQVNYSTQNFEQPPKQEYVPPKPQEQAQSFSWE